MVDNFIIRYPNEDVMKKWYKDIDTQRAKQAEERSARHTGTSETEFTYMKNVQNMPNPYQQEYEAEEELQKEAAFFSEFPTSRNASSTSLRSRSATGGSGGSAPLSAGRPQRFPMPDTPLHTQYASGTVSPAERSMPSYFSPTETPFTSARSSSQSIPYPRQTTPSNMWNEESNRYTAPAMSRGASRDSTNWNPYFNSSNSSARGPQRPSLSPFSGPQAQSPNGMAQARMRSASSPDIHHHIAHLRGHAMQTVDNVPVPPIPSHMANMRAPVNRSQTSSPTNTNLPIRSATQSQGVQQQHTQRPTQPTHFHEPQYFSRAPTLNTSQSPALDQPPSPLGEEPEPEQQTHTQPTPLSQDPLMPTQLKAKVNFDDNYVTLVIASNILYRSLTDRVDAKLARFTNRSIGGKSVRLRYKDEDGDFVTIDSDEAVQLAFMEWRDQHQEMLAKGQVGEIQLFCQPVEPVEN